MPTLPPFIDKLEIVFPVATQAPDWQYKPIVRDDVEEDVLVIGAAVEPMVLFCIVFVTELDVNARIP